MKNATLLLMALALLSGGVGRARAGMMTYSLVNYPQDQNGWTVSGTITTDGTLGRIAPTNVLSWSWTATDGSQTVSANSSLPNSTFLEFFSVLENPEPVIYADTNSLTLPDYGDGLYIGISLGSPSEDVFSWFHTNIPAMSYVGFFDARSYVWDSLAFDIAANNYAFATVAPTSSASPEPASLTLLAIGAAGLLGYGWRRRKQAESRAR